MSPLWSRRKVSLLQSERNIIILSRKLVYIDMLHKFYHFFNSLRTANVKFCRLQLVFANSLEQNVGPNLDPKLFGSESVPEQSF